MSKYLDYNGLAYFWSKLKTYISSISNVTGVKGNSESAYRTGNVNLTAANIGAIPSNTTGNTQNLYRPTQLNGLGDYTLDSKVNTLRANRLAFLPADQIIIEQTTDGGATWVSANVADSTKVNLFSETRGGVTIPLLNGVKSLQCGLRITFTAMKYNVPSGTAETQKYNYWSSTYVRSTERYNQIKEMYFWVNANSDTIRVKLERATGANPTSWNLAFQNESWGMTGWSGNDYIRFGQSVFGGATSQTTQYWNYRLTFMTRGANGGTSLSQNYTTSAQSIMEIRGYGDTWWTAGNEYAANDKIYTHDYQQNVTFPAQITATQFNGLTKPQRLYNINNIDGTTSGRPSTPDIASDNYGGVRKLLATGSMTTHKPYSDGHILNFDWDNSNYWNSQLFVSNNSPVVQTRYNNSTSGWSAWQTVGGNARNYYGTCDTAAATAAKAVACTFFVAPDLTPGNTISVIFSNTNSAAVADLTLNVNGTGAKPIKRIYNGAYTTIPAVGWIVANQIYTFTYDGTNWIIDLSQNTNTTYSAMEQSEANTGTATTARTITAKVLNDTIGNKAVLKTGGSMTGHLHMTGADIVLDPPSSSSDDSGDLVWFYGNGQEKARLWTANEYTSASGLNYRVYKKDGTSLYSGTLPMKDTTYTASTTSIGSASAGTAIAADDITAWTTNTPTAVTANTVVTGGSKTSIPNISKKTVVTSVTKKTVVTGGNTTSIPNISKKTVVTSASGATAAISNGVLTITNGSFSTGDSVTVGTAINAYTSLTTGDSVDVATGDSVTVGTAINAYTSLTTGAACSVTPGTAASLSYTARSIPNISVSSKTVVTGITQN